MQPPDTIPFSLVDLGDRVRKTYNGIEELVIGIETVGLICPLILTPTPDGRYAINDGGRRFTALSALGVTELYHGSSCVPGRPGFILKGETGDALMDLLTEISANHDRQDIPWQEELPAIVKAYRLVQKQHHARGEEITLRAFGDMLGVTYHDLQSAVKIWDAFQERPEAFAECSTVRQAMAKLLREAATASATVHVKTLAETAQLPPVAVPGGPAQPKVEVLYKKATVTEPGAGPESIIPLSQMFKNVNSLDFMDQMPDGCVNHIVTDPDYAISVEALSANSSNAHLGVIQDSVEQSLADLQRFIASAFRIVDNHGFLVFFMDLEHWEKLRDHASSVGWLVQRWPFIWRKADFRSNAAPSHNLCKNFEPAMFCRKPGAVLSEAQNTSIFECPSGNTTRRFNHPFAKPIPVWRFIYKAISVKGQRVYDPFLGSASASVAAMEHGLQPIGTELNPDHYSNALVNLQLAYTDRLGSNLKFI